MVIHSVIITFVFLSIIRITLSDVFVYNGSNEKSLEDFDAQESDLYPSFSSDGLTGYITITNPPNACRNIASPPNIPTFGYQWIALIPRTRVGDDSCDFTVKIINAYKANFSAVIIYNYEEELISMGPTGQEVGIPSVFISHSSGVSLIKKYLYNMTSVNGTPLYHVKIIVDSGFQYTAYIVPFISVIAIAFLGLIGFMFIKCYLQRRRTRRHRLPRSALKQLKTKKFVKTDPWEVCAICLDDYEEGAKLRILPCEHAYHMKCIDPWLLNNRRQCPVCKRYVFPDRDNSDDEERNEHQQARAPTEQTPLLHVNDDAGGEEISTSRNRQLPETSNNGVPNVAFAASELMDDEKELSSSSGPATTAELVFERSSSNPRRYGSTNNSSTTSRNGNFFAGSLGGATDNTNASGRSIAEDISDFETTDGNDERIHSMTYVAEENLAYADDEQSTDTNQTHL